MKKIVGFVLFFVCILCSCNKYPNDEPVIEEDMDNTQSDISEQENETMNNSNEKDNDNKVYDDDVIWGPLS